MRRQPAAYCVKMSKEALYWIGGSPCAGKSSIAAHLSEKNGLPIYACDAVFERHTDVASPCLQPILSEIPQLSCDEIWMRPINELLAREIAAYQEEYPMILQDLSQEPRPIIAEGAALLPKLVAAQVEMPQHVVYIVPTPAFQRLHYTQRPWIHGVLQHCSDPQQAFENWMNRDIAFAGHVASEARALGFRVIEVGGDVSLEDNARIVADHFGLDV